MTLAKAWSAAVLAGAALPLGGCAFSPALQTVAVDHNRMVAGAEDELALLNIVRASHRFPLHFTAITQVNGNAEVSLSSDLTLGLEPGPDPTGTSVAAEVSSSPSFQATVLATDDFQRGIQAPIEAELIAYYLDEGWRDELIMALFIERLETVDASGVVGRAIENDPGAANPFARILCTHELVTQPTTSSRPLAGFEDLIDLSIIEDQANSSDQKRKEIAAFLSLVRTEGVHLQGDTLFLAGSSNSVRLVARKQSRCADVAPDRSNTAYQMRFRSTLGVIYFLGEYLRESEENGPGATYQLPLCDSEICEGGDFGRRPVIAVRKGGGDALISTSFMGDRYFVARDEGRGMHSGRGLTPPTMARTMQVLAIVQQLINLQKSADNLPRSISITPIN